MREVSEGSQQLGGEFHALGLNLPERLFAELGDLLRDLQHGVRVVLGDGAQHVEGVDPDVCLLVRQTDQGVVEEDVEPLLVELDLLRKEVCLGRVDKFVILELLLKALDHLDPHLKVVLTVGIDEFADLLAFVGALFDQAAVRPVEMLHEELVKVATGALRILIDFNGQGLGEHQSVGKGTFNGRQAADHLEQEGVESRQLGRTLVQSHEQAIDVLFHLLNEVECKLVGHLVDLIKEGVDHVVFNLEL